MTGSVLRVLTAGALAVSAYVHLELSSSPYYAGGELTLGALFLAQAVVAAAVALWVLARPTRLAYAVAVLVAAASFGALVLSTYVRLPSPGPLPVLYEPVWYTDKVVAAVAAGVALLAAVAALATVDRRRVRSR